MDQVFTIKIIGVKSRNDHILYIVQYNINKGAYSTTKKQGFIEFRLKLCTYRYL